MEHVSLVDQRRQDGFVIYCLSPGMRSSAWDRVQSEYVIANLLPLSLCFFLSFLSNVVITDDFSLYLFTQLKIK